MCDSLKIVQCAMLEWIKNNDKKNVTVFETYSDRNLNNNVI